VEEYTRWELSKRSYVDCVVCRACALSNKLDSGIRFIYALPISATCHIGHPFLVASIPTKRVPYPVLIP